MDHKRVKENRRIVRQLVSILRRSTDICQLRNVWIARARELWKYRYYALPVARISALYRHYLAFYLFFYSTYPACDLHSSRSAYWLRELISLELNKVPWDFSELAIFWNVSCPSHLSVLYVSLLFFSLWELLLADNYSCEITRPRMLMYFWNLNTRKCTTCT